MDFINELRRRKVIRVAVVYAITAWILIQIVDVVGDPLNLPPWFSTVFIVVLALGFPIAVGLAWAFEVKPEAASGEEAPVEASGTAVGNALVDSDPGQYLITRRSVAVLPFENVSNEAEVAHVATGLTEEILNNLSRMQNLKVASRASTLAYNDTTLKAPEIGTELGVSYLVEGSIRKLADELRITAQLIRAPNDEPIWAQTFERNLSDGFEMQEKLAVLIAGQAQDIILHDASTLAALRQTQDARAYHYFRIAADETRHQVSGDHTPNNQLLMENYTRAAERDPDFAAAHQGIAHACTLWFDLGMTREEAFKMGHAAMERAMALRPPSAMSYMVLSQIHAAVDANYPAALDATEKGLAIAPNMAWLHGALNRIALRQGRISDALRHARTAAQLSPGDSGINRFLGLTLWAAGDLKGAISAMEATLDIMTAGAYYTIRAAELAMVLLQCAETDRANEILDNVVRSLNHDTSALGQSTANPRCSLCLALAQAGRTADVRAIKEDLQSEHGSNWFPGRYEMHLAAGEIDEAFDYLRQGIDQRSGDVFLLRTELPFLSPLREDRRWQEVMTHLEDMEARSAAGE